MGVCSGIEREGGAATLVVTCGGSAPKLGELFTNKNVEEPLFCCKGLFYIQKAVEKLLVYNTLNN